MFKSPIFVVPAPTVRRRVVQAHFQPRRLFFFFQIRPCFLFLQTRPGFVFELVGRLRRRAR
jgi:hypothetical protein